MKRFNRFLAVVLSVLMVLTAMVFPSSAADFDASWTAVSTEAELKAIANDLTGKYYLTNNITLTEEWFPLGWTDADDVAFTGKFDGNNYKISNLYMDYPTGGTMGLFAIVGESATVSNLNLVVGDVLGYCGVGGIAGINYGTISRCNVSGNTIVCLKDPKAADRTDPDTGAGAIAASNRGLIELCSSNVSNVGSIYYAGGIAGENYGTIRTCSSKSSINSTLGTSGKVARYYAGGIAGRTYGRIEDVFVNGGMVKGSEYVGCITGMGYSKSVINRAVVDTDKAKLFSYPSTGNYFSYGVGNNLGSVNQTVSINAAGTQPTYNNGLTLRATTSRFNELVASGSVGGVAWDNWSVDANGNVVFTDLICLHENTELINKADATCTDNGYTGDTVCKDCHAVVTAGEVIKSTGHVNGEAVETNRVNSTCSAEGSYDLVVKCTVCNEVVSTEKKTIDKLPHTEGEWIVDKAATCTEEGSKHKKCTVCGETTDTEVIPVTDHSEVTVDAKDATCTENGYTGDTVCSVCGVTLATGTEITASGHTAKWQVTDYTHRQYCEKCGEVLVAAASHSATDWQVSNASTCLIEGTETATCVCGKELTRSIPVDADAHTYDSGVVTKAATCAETGIKTFSCPCGASYTEKIEMVPHVDADHDFICDNCAKVLCDHEGMGTTVINSSAATCTVDGYTGDTVCENCHTILIAGEVIKHTGHVNGEAVEENKVDATCSAEGSYDLVVKCTVCKEVVSTEKKTIEKLPHTEGEWIVDKDATCTVAGSKHKKCTVCGETTDTEVIPVTDHSEVLVGAKAATCTVDGYTGDTVCEYCNTVIATGEVIEKLPHTESDWIVDQAATCTAEGSKHKECTVCGATIETEVIPVTDHSVVLVGAKATTCTADGYTGDTVCENCGLKVADGKIIKAKGHVADEYDFCKVCGIDLNPTRDCECICHNRGLVPTILYRIIVVFWQIFNINRECECGGLHY